jgi:raffinose/stachyose/melibiose transport system permease protein
VTGRSERTLNYLILVAFTGLAIVPLIGLLLAALHRPGEMPAGFSLPDRLDLSSFRNAWTEGHFSTYLRSSAIVAVSVVVASALLAIPAGYAFGTMRFPGATPLFYVFLIGMIVPFEAMILPLYYNLRDLGLTETYWALILPQVGLSISFGTFWMRAFFRSAPRELIEAARMDGATSWTVLWRVLVPIGRPAITTMMVLIFMWTWNDFLLALVMVTDEGLRTAPLGLSYFQGRFGSDVPGLAAAAVIVALPVVIVYVFLQRHFIRGMLSGAIKE